MADAAEAMKRFWKEVRIDTSPGGHALRLDDRPVRTPGLVPLAVPTLALAEAIAGEWRAVEGTIDPRAMPLTGLANAAIDRIAPDPSTFAAGIAGYAESDLLCYRAEAPEPLIERQQAAWDPLLDWARTRYDVHFTVTAGVMHKPQPRATLERLREAVMARGAWELAALSPIVTIGGSLISALALAESAADADTIWRAVELDEDWQVEMWGEDSLAVTARESRKHAYEAAVRFLGMV